ncbi:hypothetical protein [Gilliamella sp. wkB178]|nr:hypothetical protein [Gilliamella apicola]
MVVTADLAVMVLMIVAADLGSWVADGAVLNRGLNYHFGERS